MVVAPPASSAPCEGEVSEGWSPCEQPACLPTSMAAGPGVSEPIDSSLTSVSCTTIGDDLAIGPIELIGPIDSSLTTVSCCTIDTGNIASRAERPTFASHGQENLQTEPNFRPEREPNNPDIR